VKVTASFERSGKSQAAFCENRELELGTFRHWLYRLRHEQREAPKSEHFVPLVARSGTNSVALRFRSGASEADFAELPPASYVAELLRLMDR
jgi:hypothetical protein